MSITEQLAVHIKARYPMLLLETHEEERAIDIIEGIAKEQNKHLYVWTSTRGIVSREKEPRVIGGTNDPIKAVQHVQTRAKPPTKTGEKREEGERAIYVFLDYHPFMDPGKHHQVIRLLRDTYTILKGTYVSIVFISPAMKIVEDLQKSITIIDLPFPDINDLGEIFDFLKVAYTDLHPDDTLFESINREEICTAGLGLTLEEFENALGKCIVRKEFTVAAISQEKSQIIRKGGLLEYYDPSDGIGDVGGLDALKEWLKKVKRRYSPEAEAYGLERPKFVLFFGPPGTGKSLMARVVAKELELPLFRFDMATLTTSLYGATANNVKKALNLASTASPCIIWFDEFEKMLASGQGGAGSGHEETMRAKAVILTDYEENPKPIFRIATCNSLAGIPPEFMSRFEIIFFVDLPNMQERREIFAIHLRKFGLDPDDFDLDRIASETEGFVGREIHTMIKEAMSSAFYDGARKTTTEDILDQKAKMKPVSEQDITKEEIETNRQWARDNARFATTQPGHENGSGRVARIIEVE